jgi:transposase InsO family protein
MEVKDRKVDIPSSKVIERSFVKDASEKIALQRLRTLKLAEELKNISEACRRGSMDRTSFYEWKRRYQLHGLDGLLDQPPVPKSHPKTTPTHVRDAVIELSFKHPSWGSKRAALELTAEGMTISNWTVQSILNKAKLGTRFERMLRLEAEALKGAELPKDQIELIEKLNPCFKERHIQSKKPGDLVGFDTFFVGTFKGIGRVYLYTAVDTFGSYAFGMLATARTALCAAQLLYGQVIPFYEAHKLKFEAALSDNGTEFCGTQEHAFEEVLYLSGIKHKRTRVRRPQSNGFTERFHRTILDEFFRTEMRRRTFDSLESLELAVQQWLCYYNLERPHQGYRNMGKTPYQIVEAHLQSVKQES